MCCCCNTQGGFDDSNERPAQEVLAAAEAVWLLIDVDDHEKCGFRSCSCLDARQGRKEHSMITSIVRLIESSDTT